MDGTKPWFKDVLKIAHAENTPGVRAAVRFPLNIPVTVHLDEKTVEAKTENVSASGISLLTTQAITPGQPIRFCLNMPGEAMGIARDVHISCYGRVVRCQPRAEKFLIAATIDNYKFSKT
jgi:hypothetical protein